METTPKNVSSKASKRCEKSIFEIEGRRNQRNKPQEVTRAFTSPLLLLSDDNHMQREIDKLSFF